MLELVFTISAWKRGWKAWSLLPYGIAFIIAFIWVAADRNVGKEQLFILDVAVVVALIFMTIKPRKQPSVAHNNIVVQKPQVIELAQVTPPTQIVPVTVIYQEPKAKLMTSNNGEIPFTGPITYLGRNDLAKVVSAESLSYISRQQFLLKSDAGKFFLEDENSANGTKLNGVQIKNKGQHALSDGDRIDIAGVATLTFKLIDI